MIPSIGPSDSEKKITKKYKRMVDLQKAYVTKRVLDDETATEALKSAILAGGMGAAAVAAVHDDEPRLSSTHDSA